MIRQIGVRTALGDVHFDPGHLCVFVGPNNSGKSLALRELVAAATHPGHPPGKLITGVELKSFSTAEATDLVRGAIVDTGSRQRTGMISIRTSLASQHDVESTQVQETQLIASLALRSTSSEEVRALLRAYTVVLDGAQRVNLLTQTAATEIPRSLLRGFVGSQAARTALRNEVYSALGKYLVFDHTDITLVTPRLSDRPPASEEEELAPTALAKAFHQNSRPLGEQSDGVKAFCGMAGAVHASAAKILAIDEPEAFLSPPLARTLGRSLAKQAAARSGNVFIATHSAEFLMGAVDSQADITIVSLGYVDGRASAKVLEPADLKQMIRDARMRSVSPMRALFHRSCFVTEADADRAFYELANERMSQTGNPHVADCLFLNVNGKDVISNIVGPLRKLGVPAAAVMDLDGLTTLDKLLPQCNVPTAIQVGLLARRDAVVKTFASRGLKLKTGGISQLPSADRLPVYRLVSLLGRWGIFLAEVGELEYWLRTHVVMPIGKNEWLEKAFELLSIEPGAQGYLTPNKRDAWRFLRRVQAWTGDPDRLGLQV